MVKTILASDLLINSFSSSKTSESVDNSYSDTTPAISFESILKDQASRQVNDPPIKQDNTIQPKQGTKEKTSGNNTVTKNVKEPTDKKPERSQDAPQKVGEEAPIAVATLDAASQPAVLSVQPQDELRAAPATPANVAPVPDAPEISPVLATDATITANVIATSAFSTISSQNINVGVNINLLTPTVISALPDTAVVTELPSIKIKIDSLPTPVTPVLKSPLVEAPEPAVQGSQPLVSNPNVLPETTSPLPLVNNLTPLKLAEAPKITNPLSGPTDSQFQQNGNVASIAASAPGAVSNQIKLKPDLGIGELKGKLLKTDLPKLYLPDREREAVTSTTTNSDDPALSSSGLSQTLTAISGANTSGQSGLDLASGQASRTAETNLNASAADVKNQVMQAMVSQVQAGRKEVSLQLNPIELGSVRIQLNSIGPQQVAGRLIVETPEALTGLKQDISQLKDSLAKQGIQMEHVSVVLAVSASGSAGQQSSSFQHPSSNPNPDDANRPFNQTPDKQSGNQGFNMFQQDARQSQSSFNNGNSASSPFVTTPGALFNAQGEIIQANRNTSPALQQHELGQVSLLA